MDDFQQLDETKHMLEWLSENPYSQMRSQMEASLNLQVPNSRIEVFKVSSAPQWFTGFRSDDNDETKSILTKVCVAFDIELLVSEANSSSTKLKGIYSWVGINLDKSNAKQRIWFDINETVKESDCKGTLLSRMSNLAQD